MTNLILEMCEQKLRDLRKNSPDQLTDCVKTYMANNNPEKFDCVSIKEKGGCFLKDVEKHCDPKFLEVYKEHQDLRLYNRACDGRLRYKVWDLTRTQEFAIHSVPGGIKMTDPKRNETGTPNTTRFFGGLCVSTFFVLMRSAIICILLPYPSNGYSYRGKDIWKTGCTYAGEHAIPHCRYIIGFKNFWRHNSIAWFPEQTRNMSYTELKKHCDDSFVCLENTGCYKDFVNYQELDKCIDDVFWLGPMGFCETKLREVLKSTPDKLEECVQEYLKDKNPDRFDCVSINNKGKCFEKDVEKHCEPRLLPMYREHQNLRLYNRACDGRLRYKDWDMAGSQDYALQFNPGGLKVSDPKRDVLKAENEETTGANSTDV
ncbi:Protein CBG04720 [Caenorhabditis briggsae]|uniref:Protein CBG04720 n=1 Tax=Caenorhabditis briggsae TaxID=6238 RepID=A8WYB2_CAEBR|nr:Protein CBG04720 [Caenorhabditis briggsae]CAP25370.2 Protein CBG04720 [Caenorhabditis briggsae]